jgi:hypothetical protein
VSEYGIPFEIGCLLRDFTLGAPVIFPAECSTSYRFTDVNRGE